MKEQALKLAEDFDELAQIGFEMVLMAEGDSPISKQVAHYQIQYAKDHQRNAQLLRDLVAEIEISDSKIGFLEAYIKQLESGLDSAIAFSKAQAERNNDSNKNT
jgi:hypothetical protein